MMRTSGRIMISCAALFLALTSVSAVQRLNSIEDLKKINFGQSVPTHSLVLLHWFANAVEIDNNNVIRLTFDPELEEYGSHHYGNYERMLDPLPRGYRYYTVGNLRQGVSPQLPDHVIYPRPGYEGRNMDRIIFRVRERNVAPQIIDQVYITQHYETNEHQGTRYDPDHTYQVTVNLLRQIRQFPMAGNLQRLRNLRDRFGSNADDSQLSHITNMWGHLACLGLMLFIVIQEKNSSNQKKNRPRPAARRNPQPRDFVVDIPESRPNGYAGMFCLVQVQEDGIGLEVTTGKNGKARILWRNVPRHCLKEGVMVVLYSNNEAEEDLTYHCIGNKESGSYDTSVPLNEGLQVRLHKVRKVCCFWSARGEEICRGTEFETPNSVNIAGYDARLQLFVKDGKASARLYVGKSFHGWRKKFKNSWVGFYSSEDEDTNNYEWWQWQWATRFKRNPSFTHSSYDVYEYKSGMAVAPGVQARFLLDEGYNALKASTPGWSE